MTCPATGLPCECISPKCLPPDDDPDYEAARIWKEAWEKAHD